MINNKLHALYGMKYNPFSCEVPEEALYPYPSLENFYWRIENVLLREGGFALVSGDSGTGKSVALRLTASRLKNKQDVSIGIITHSTARLSDFYREMGDVFGVALTNSNRWGGFKNLRERWVSHLQSTLFRPVLFIDEAQDMLPSVLNELRMLTSMNFDSQVLLSVVLAGDQRLNAQLQREDLIPLESRIKVRLRTGYTSPEELRVCLNHLLVSAGNPNLMTPELIQTLCEHSAGNYRSLCKMAGDMLAAATQQERTQIMDEKMYFECFPANAPHTNRKKS